MKVCFKCNEAKPLTEYYRHSGMSDGHLNKCKQCTKKDVRNNRADKREQYSDYEQLRQQSPARKAKKLIYGTQHKQRNPVKHRARWTLQQAVRRGRIEKLPCDVCGDPKSQAHHDDYSKPLDVRWLCFKHHREREHAQTVVVTEF